jgi:AAHS family 4-hydroxybenzoate transporter-like MFS transporter
VPVPSHASYTTNVTDLIDRRPLSALQIRVFVLGTLVILFDGANTISISVAAPSIAAALKLPISAFGPIFSAGQAGLLIGALALGPLADRWGRKALVIASTLVFGIFSLFTPWAASFDQLFMFRLLAGIGLGGAAPNVVALASEYAPKRMRSSLVTLMWAAFPLGGVLIGLMGAGSLDWQMIFYIGGAVPIAVSLLLLSSLPESPTFLIMRGGDTRRAAGIVRRIAPDLSAAALDRLSVTDQKLPGVPVKYLFSKGSALGTLLLWIPFFCDFLILVSVNSWTPSLLRASGFSVSRAGFAIALNSIGSMVGAIIVGRLMDRFGAYFTLTAAFLGAAVSVGTLGYATSTFTVIAVFVTLSGFFAGAAQAGVIALAALMYPVSVRSTGVGWAMALGRLGAVVGPLAGGILLGLNFTVARTFLAFAIPGLCGAAAVVLIQQRSRRAAAVGIAS